MLGVLGISEVVLVLRPSQPSPHQLAFPGFAALRFKAVALAMSSATIGKKEFLTVQALASGIGRLHRFHRQRKPLRQDRTRQRKKTHPEEDSDRRRRKKSFQRILRRKSKGRRSHSRPSVLHPFHFNGGTSFHPRLSSRIADWRTSQWTSERAAYSSFSNVSGACGQCRASSSTATLRTSASSSHVRSMTSRTVVSTSFHPRTSSRRAVCRTAQCLSSLAAVFTSSAVSGSSFQPDTSS